MIDKQLAVFDIDGTLFRTECVTVPAVRRTFAARGLPLPDEAAICAFFGRSAASYEAWLAAQCPPGLAEEVIAATNELELRLIAEEGRLYDGARNALETLRDAGYRMAVCSNGPEPYVAEFLRAHGLGALFDVVQARGARRIGKTDMLGAILNILHPEAFVVVGDRRDDIEAAHAWGGRAVAAVYGFGNEEEWRAADARIESIAEAPGCIRQLLTPSSM